MTENGWWSTALTALFVTLLSLARIAHGFFWSIPGPTLTQLATNVNDDVDTIFSYRSIGVFVGSCLSGYFFPKLGSGRWKLLSLGIILCIDSVGLATMPIVKSMGLLAFIIMLTGGTSGWLNSGITSLFLTTWGPEKSKPYIASFHFTFSIGATLAPYLVGIYMDPNTEAQCSNTNSTRSITSMATEECDPKWWPVLCEDDYFDDLDKTIIMPYWIVAIAVFLTGIIMIICALLKLVEAVTTKKNDIVDTRKEDTWKDSDMIFYFIVVMMIFFCAADMDTIYQSYLKIYGMCSPTFQLTPKDANDVVTIFWIAFAFGRLSGIFLTPFFRSWSYVAVDIVGSVIAVVVLICLEYLLENKGDENYQERQIALIVPTIIFAVMVSCIYGCATNFTNEYTNMSLSYIYLTQAGNSIGVMTLPAVTGALVKDDPVWMLWMVFIVSIGCAVFMFLTHLQGKRVLTKFADDHKVHEVKFDGIENDACTTDEPNKYQIE